MNLNLISLKVEDWNRMVTFYQEVIGLEPIVLEPEHRYGWLEAGTVRLSLMGKDGLAPAENSRLSLQFQVEDLLEAMKNLEMRGCVFFDKQLDTGEPYRMAQFHDPEGNAIAIYELLSQ